MGPEDLDFLVWAMRFLKGGPHDNEEELVYWRDQFHAALRKHFPDYEEQQD
jgi:hypothetical protein